MKIHAALSLCFVYSIYWLFRTHFRKARQRMAGSIKCTEFAAKLGKIILEFFLHNKRRNWTTVIKRRGETYQNNKIFNHTLNILYKLYFSFLSLISVLQLIYIVSHCWSGHFDPFKIKCKINQSSLFLFIQNFFVFKHHLVISSRSSMSFSL